jgi:SAM-dependent methyltransferase
MVRKSFAEYEREGWDQNAPAYDAIVLPGTGQAFDPLLDSLGDLAGASLLEVCSGTGNLAARAIARGARVTGLDAAPGMVGIARRTCPDGAFEEGDGEALPYDDSSFDAVVCGFGLLHMTRPGAAIGEAARVLRPGGRYAFTVWAEPAEGNEFFGAMLGTFEEMAEMDLDLPAAPPMFAMADAAYRDPLLEGAGFIHISARQIAIQWPLDGAHTLTDFIEQGGVRTKMILEGQTEETSRHIRQALIAHAERYLQAGKSTIPSPAILVSATKGCG